MPFTFSHPALILPLKRISGESFSLTGLIIGSITPDFEYFIRMKVESIYSHSLLGLFWFDVPLALLLTFVYHLMVRDQLVNNLPGVLNKKLFQFKSFNWPAYFKRNWITVLVSIFIGAASHLFWDDFTHPTGYFVQRIALLQKMITIESFQVPLFSILQQLSTLAGGVIVIWAIFNLDGQPLHQSNKKAAYWIFVGIIAFLITVGRQLSAFNYHRYGDIIVTIISAIMIGFVLSPIFLKSFSKKHPLPGEI